MVTIRDMKAAVLLLVVLFLTPPAAGGDRDHSAGWQNLGRGAAVIFTPDLSVPTNRHFYEALGFLYLEGPSWHEVIADLKRHNATNRENPVRTVVVESHGTNGHGLKLQSGRARLAPRSYISVGGLQQELEPAGITTVVLSACNAGRLFRPEIYRALDRSPGDRLFLPPTRGIVDAAASFDPDASRVRMLRRATSHLETLMHAFTSELPDDLRISLEARNDGEPFEFVISTMLIQLLIEDDDLRLTGEGHEVRLSRDDFTRAESEALLGRFVGNLASSTSSAERWIAPLLAESRSGTGFPAAPRGGFSLHSVASDDGSGD
jgi:hypothetical protein